MTVIHTDRLTLTPCLPSDRADFIALELDPEVMRFLNGGAVNHEKIEPETVTFLMPRGTEPHVWTARRRCTGEFVGWVCLSPASDTVAEIGYRLCRKEWGQGLASEGALALLGWGFSKGGYEKIIATTMTVNTGSRRVMEKIHMTYVRTDYYDWPDPISGSEQGDVVYEVNRLDWFSRSDRMTA
ncbi:GNAT family N-acetyltransferase [Agrobacterium vitis]